jgi:pyrroloquinoline quinone biosynthesis protein B
MLKVLVLGAAAGGGLPQWNCNCDNCRRARLIQPALRSTQASIAVSADGDHWFLINAAPDLRQQIIDTPQLHPRHGLRDTPIVGVILTNGDVDAIAGLLCLREGARFDIHAHQRVLDVLAENTIFNVLDPQLVKRNRIDLEKPFEPTLADGTRSGLEVVAFAVPGKIPLYLEEGGDAPNGYGSESGETIGLHVRNRRNGLHFFYLAACARVTAELAERVRGAPLVFFDGTLFRDDEMIRAGLGSKTGQRMGHLSMSGDGGSLRALEPLGIRRKLFLHINNSNPALMPDTAERREIEHAGWEIPADGMEIVA